MNGCQGDIFLKCNWQRSLKTFLLKPNGWLGTEVYTIKDFRFFHRLISPIGDFCAHFEFKSRSRNVNIKIDRTEKKVQFGNRMMCRRDLNSLE